MPTKTSRLGYKPLALGLIVLAAALVVAGVISRRSVAGQVKEASTPLVPAVSILPAGQMAGAPIDLSARIEPWARAPIYARVSGYLKSWKVDIGAPVKSGQTLVPGACFLWTMLKDRKSTRLNSSHNSPSRMPSSA